MKTSPTEKRCNYATHTSNNPFVRADLGKYFLTSNGTIRIIDGGILVGDDGAYKELVALTCLACGERWYIEVK